MKHHKEGKGRKEMDSKRAKMRKREKKIQRDRRKREETNIINTGTGTKERE